MRTVAITNFKGGVGKTTTTISVGAGMALKGLRVLLAGTVCASVTTAIIIARN